MRAVAVRRWWWRLAFQVAGGMTTVGRLPAGACVVVANTTSIVDKSLLLAAFDRAHRPSFSGSAPSGTLVFLQPRAGSGDDQVALACRAAAAARVPLVPVGINGTGGLIGRDGGLRPRPVAVRIGRPIMADPDTVREAVTALAAAAVPVPDCALRRRLAVFAGTGVALLVMGWWAAAEAISFPILPEFALVILAVAAPRRALHLALAAVAGTLVGGAIMYALATHGISPPTPLTTPRMHAVAAAQVSARGPAAVLAQPMSGIPYKVYALAAGRAHTGPVEFLVTSAPARGLRMLAVGALAAGLAALCRRWRRWYATFLLLFVTVFTAALTAVVRSWS